MVERFMSSRPQVHSCGSSYEMAFKPAETAGMPPAIDPPAPGAGRRGRSDLGGISPPEAYDPPDQPLEVVHSQWDEMVWPMIAERVPAFAAVKVVNAWVGYYEYSTFDQNGIVGRHPEIANMLVATGFSGHGIQQSPATGRAVSELIVDGRYRTLDLAPFGFERIAARQPIRELNVV